MLDFCFYDKQKSKTVLCFENGTGFCYKCTTSHSFELRNEINNNICRYCHAKKILGMDFFIDICTCHVCPYLTLCFSYGP